MVGISEKLMGIARRPEERADDTTEA
jgi:hypothetical protein